MKAKTSMGLLLATALAFLLLPATALAEDVALTVTGGIENTDYEYVGGGRVTVLSSTPLTISGRPAAASIVIDTSVVANLTLEDATINTASGSAIHIFPGATLNLTVVGDNTLRGTSACAGLDVNPGQTLVITEESTGTLNVMGGEYGAGIGGGKGQSGGTIIIEGGTVNATGGEEGAGIGGGGSIINPDDASRNITISGGTVNAIGGKRGAGIGGGAQKSAGTITIKGGTVTAQGGEWGAGIGGGYYYTGDGGDIAIKGGTIHSQGGEYGAGIGGGHTGDGGDITIEDGTVHSQGGEFGAGVGGGYGGDGGNITISGGTVEATGGERGAGIGGGTFKNGGTIIIESGMVKAQGGDWGAGIGGGYSGDSGTVVITGGVVFANSTTGRDVGRGHSWSEDGYLELSGTGALFLKNGTSPTPITTTHTREAVTGHLANSAVYGIPVAWSGDFSAYLRLCRLSYDPNGGSGSLAVAQHIGTTAPLATGGALSRTGYALSGWNEAEEGGGTDFAMGETYTFLEPDVRLFAKWMPHTYTVQYDASGETGGTTAASTHTYDEPKTLTPNGFTRQGYRFAGWATGAEGPAVYTNSQSVLNLTADDNGAVTLYAQWTPHTYTVQYDANGGMGGTTAASVHTYDVPAALTPNGFTRAGYRFAGWATGAEGPVVYTNRQSVLNLTADDNGAVTLYAQWEVYSEPKPVPLPAPQGTIVNCRSGVNVRSGPGTNYPILGFAPKGAAYTIIEKIGTWYKVAFGSQVGYISASYISVPAPEAGQGMVINCKHSVNVRSGPGRRYSILGFAPRGAAYTILKKSGSWYQIEFNGRTAYISADYFSAGNG